MTPSPVEFRPRRIRVVSRIAAVAFVVLFAVISFGLGETTGAGGGQFRPGDQAAMIGLGVLGGLAVLVFARPRVWADADGIRIRNVIGGYELPWSVVRAVRFDRHSAWAHLELHDDETVPVHALQAADKEYAVDAVRTLRRLHGAGAQPPTDPAAR